MLSKCANPACSTPFRYLRDGKIFEIDSTREPGSNSSDKKSARRVEFFWLCGECSLQLTIVNDHEKGAITAPLPQGAQFLVRRAAA